MVEPCHRGDPALEAAGIAAARRLLERGAVAITSNCGFFIRHQAAIAASVKVPVAVSSRLLVPTLLRQLPPSAKLAVVTADSRHCDEGLLGVDDPVERQRVLIGGGEEGECFVNSMKDGSEDQSERPPNTDYSGHLETDVAACLARLRAAHRFCSSAAGSLQWRRPATTEAFVAAGCGGGSCPLT